MDDLMDRILKSGELYAGFMNTAMEAFSATCDKDQDSEALNDLYENVTRRYLSFYEESVGSLLKAPQFGVFRESLQHMTAAGDAFNRFMAALSDFTIKFNLPLRDAFEELMEVAKEKKGTEKDFKSAREIYDAAVTLLDEKYDAHIKSPEGVQMVVDVVQKYLDFKKKADVVNDIWLKFHSIPTSEEMEDVYRSIYELKRKTRQQASVIQNLEARIEGLSRKVQALETSPAKAAK
ncbi:MAG TPA: poly(R)-hydroxyalkanoic acid synthase subunit PhaE [Desulfobacteria bacterium]|nr:poly(R)-hydroxyalkanoic acid synthase subunit PhaE [Desulfobacteria bacterium]